MIYWNKYVPKTTNQAQNKYLDFLIDPSFHEVNRLFVLSFKDDDGRESHKKYDLLTVKIKDFNILINGRNFFKQPLKNDFKIYDNIRKIAKGLSDYYATGCILDFFYFKKYCKLIVIDLTKQQKPNANPKAIQQINFTRKLGRAEAAAILGRISAADTAIQNKVYGSGTTALVISNE